MRNFYLDIYPKAAQKLDLHYQEIRYEKHLLGRITNPVSGYTVRLIGSILDLNSAVSHLLANDKYLTGKLLKENVEAYPDSILLDSQNEHRLKLARQFAEDRNYEVVVKPVDGNKGRGVRVLPKGYEYLKEAIIDATQIDNNKSALVEEFIPGDDYRVSSIDGEIIGLVKRIPAFVTGDGEKTISQLIEEKNALRQIYCFAEIKKNRALQFLSVSSKQNLSTVLKRGERQQLEQLCNLSLGGEVIHVDIKKLHKDYHSLIKEIADIFQLRLFTVDFRSTDLSKYPRMPHAGINEINFNISPDVFFYADLESKIPYSSAKYLLKKVFSLK
jgi:glutamate--cysteine ligase